jgi:predicted 2-oxoglutarate/Fe(II)-dependent dioxygenase YbiX
MYRVETGSNQIFRYDNVLRPDICKEICDLLIESKGDHLTSLSQSDRVPWNDNDVCNFRDIKNLELKAKINEYRHLAKNLAMVIFKSIVFIDYTDLVVWRTGKAQNRHKDNGYVNDSPLMSRKFTCITYLNDDFEGGRTFIKTERGDDYISDPRTGSAVFFYSDDRCEHGVTKVENGIRMTLPIWFCTDYSSSEEARDSKIAIQA